MVDRDPKSPHDDIDPDAPASAEEVAASKRLRDALEGAATEAASPEIELALSLRAAWDPGTLSASESLAMLDATPSAEEQDLALRLRDALAAKREPLAADTATVQLAHALRSAFAPAAIDGTEHQAILDAALAKMPAKAEKPAANVIAMRRRATVVRVAFGFVAGGLALAASVVLVVTSAPGPGSEAPLAKARTTQPLFSEPFKPGETSARIDRIASARAGDFRDNRFTKWGVR
ncbi:MAG: hypothetical protein JWO86_1936 [Myxococcaceae bacterium]|jgi:hypothetical protein|nr:hypothetical protein [Myxococcaceae bacterium]